MRSAFTQFHELSPIIWMVLDYCIDCVYFMDIFVGLRTGELNFFLYELFIDLNKLRKVQSKS